MGESLNKTRSEIGRLEVHAAVIVCWGFIVVK